MKDAIESALFYEELEYYGLSREGMQPLACKAGVSAARVRCGDGTAVLKCFENAELRREIRNYDILQSCGIPTLEVLGKSKRSILLEDIAASEKYRLGKESDLGDPNVIRAIAKWYRTLHTKGSEFVRLFGGGMYEEWDHFTLGNILAIRKEYGLSGSRGIRALADNYDELRRLLDEAPRTLTYNDFYYTNLAVGKDASEALMFDHDMLGKGCCVTDIRNVIYWFSEENKQLFLSEYGNVDGRLMLLDEICAPVVSLTMAMSRSDVPAWVKEALDDLEKTPEIITKLLAQ